MKKLYLLMAFLGGSLYLSAQEKIAGGNMEDESKWTVLDVTQAQTNKVGADVTFNYGDDTPAKGEGNCLRISGDGRVFIYQKVALTPGKTYALSAAFKAVSGDDVYQYYWNEVNIVRREPFVDAEHDDFGAGKGEYQLGMHYWKNIQGGASGDSTVDYSRMDSFDGLLQESVSFSFLGVAMGGTTDSILSSPRDASFTTKNFKNGAVIFTLPDTVKTTDWYVLIKSGGNAEKDVLFDEISLKEIDLQNAISSISKAENAFDVYPNPVTNGDLTIKTKAVAGEVTFNLYNTTGMLIKSGVVKGTLDVSDVNKGVFILQLESGSQIEQHKIIIK